MRVYLPVSWTQLAVLQETGGLSGPLRGCVVDPDWRAAAPEVDEEEWEYEAAVQAAAGLPMHDLDGGGMVLAVELSGEVTHPVDGWVTVLGQVQRPQVDAVLDAELAWFGVQELSGLLADRSGP